MQNNSSSSSMTTDKESFWYIGVILVVFSSLVGALGDNLVRLSFLEEEKKPEDKRRKMVERPLWISGTLLSTVLNTALVVSALAFCKPSIITPFAGLHIAWNIPIAHYMLQEKVGMVDIIGSIIIMCGIVMVVAFGAHGHFELDHESLKGYLFKQSMFIYAVVFFFCAAVCVTATWVSDAERILKYAKDPVRTTRSPVMRNSSSSHHMQPIDSLDSPANTADNQRSTKHKFLSYLARPQVGLFCCSAASGLFGGNTNVFAKAAIEVVSKESFGGFQHPVVVFVAILTISCALMQLYFLNESLKRYEAVYCVPIINAALVAVAAIASNILFDDWKQISTSDMCFFCVGALLVVGGILSLYFTDRREGENVNAPTIAELDDEEALFADTFDDNDFIVQNTMESKNGSKRLIDDQERTKLIERGYLATQTKFGGDQELKFMGTGTGNNSGSNGGTPNKKKNLSNSSPGEFIFGDNFDGIAQPTRSAMSRVSTPEQSPRQHKNDMEDDDDDLFGTRAKQQQQKQPSLLL